MDFFTECGNLSGGPGGARPASSRASQVVLHSPEHQVMRGVVQDADPPSTFCTLLLTHKVSGVGVSSFGVGWPMRSPEGEISRPYVSGHFPEWLPLFLGVGNLSFIPSGPGCCHEPQGNVMSPEAPRPCRIPSPALGNSLDCLAGTPTGSGCTEEIFLWRLQQDTPESRVQGVLTSENTAGFQGGNRKVASGDDCMMDEGIRSKQDFLGVQQASSLSSPEGFAYPLGLTFFLH